MSRSSVAWTISLTMNFSKRWCQWSWIHTDQMRLWSSVGLTPLPKTSSATLTCRSRDTQNVSSIWWRLELQWYFLEAAVTQSKTCQGVGPMKRGLYLGSKLTIKFPSVIPTSTCMNPTIIICIFRSNLASRTWTQRTISIILSKKLQTISSNRKYGLHWHFTTCQKLSSLNLREIFSGKWLMRMRTVSKMKCNSQLNIPEEMQTEPKLIVIFIKAKYL